MTDIKLANGYVETDDSTYQFVKNMGEGTFRVVQIADLPIGENETRYFVGAKDVNVLEMTDEEIHEELSGYYDQEERERIISKIRKGGETEMQITAEAVFENNLLYPGLTPDMDFGMAKTALQNFILTDHVEKPKSEKVIWV